MALVLSPPSACALAISHQLTAATYTASFRIPDQPDAIGSDRPLRSHGTRLLGQFGVPALKRGGQFPE
jgi:hypothetical protein